MADDAAVAFAELYARYHGRLRGLVTHRYGPADAEDIAQEAMARAYASFGTLDRARDPWPWLVAIARNVATDRYARPRPVPLADVPVAAADATADVEERAVVGAALSRLSRADRDVLVLREWHELSIGELAQLLGRSPNTVRQQVFRARRRLADAYVAVGGRVVAVAAWARWRAPGERAAQGAAGQLAAAGQLPAAGQLAAVVLGAALAAGGGGAPPARAPEREPPPVAAGPAAHGGTPAGPAAGSAAPARPLLPPGAAPSAGPRPAPPRPAGATPVRGTPPPPDRAERRVSVETDQAGHDYDGGPAAGDGVVCAVLRVCPFG